MRSFFFIFRRKRLLAKYLLHRRPCKHCRKILVSLISIPQHFQPAFHKRLIQIIRAVIAVVVVKLAVCRRRIAPALSMPSVFHRRHRIPENHRLQPKLCKIVHRPAHDTLKPDLVMDAHGLFLRQVFVRHFKPDTVAFGKRIRHRLDLIVWQAGKVLCAFQLIFRNIFPIPVQICQIVQIGFPHNPCEKIKLRVNAVSYTLRYKDFAVIMKMPV